MEGDGRDDDGRRERTRITHQYDETTPPSVAVVRATAALEDIDPVDWPADGGPALYEHVDPDALDTLLESSESRVTVSFAFGGYRVVVESDGRVRVREPVEPSESVE